MKILHFFFAMIVFLRPWGSFLVGILDGKTPQLQYNGDFFFRQKIGKLSEGVSEL